MSHPHIRPATSSDIPSIAAIDFITNKNQPFSIPWAKPEDGLAMFTKRFEFLFTQPGHEFLVMSDGREGGVLGFIVWKGPGEEEEWRPEFPEGTNVEFLNSYLEGIAKGAGELGVDGLYEVESLAIAPEHQRKGLGTMLLRELTKRLDEWNVGCYLRASSMGKELYERFGWRVLGIHRPDLKKWGYEEEYVGYYMRRDSKS